MRAIALVALLVLAAGCNGEATGPGQSSPPAEPSPTGTPLDQIDVREGMETAVEEGLQSFGVPEEARAFRLELEELDDFGPVVLVEFTQVSDDENDLPSYRRVIARATHAYAPDLERLGYRYVGWQLPLFGSLLAKTTDWSAFEEREITEQELIDRMVEDCC